MNGVAALGGGDLGPQRVGAAVVGVQNRQRAGQPAVFERLERGPEDSPGARTRRRATPRARAGSFPASQPRREPHDTSPFGTGLRYNEDAIAPGAQTERRGGRG